MEWAWPDSTHRPSCCSCTDPDLERREKHTIIYVHSNGGLTKLDTEAEGPKVLSPIYMGPLF